MRRAAIAAVVAAAAVVFAPGCGSSASTSYDARGDARFAGLVAGAWVTRDGAVAIAICEDTSATRWVCKENGDVGRALACSAPCHVARGDGTSASESLGGGDGCPTPLASLAVRVTGADFDVEGEADVEAETHDAYGGPITLRGASAGGDDAPAASLAGDVSHDGTMHLTLRARADGAPSTTTDLDLVHVGGDPCH